MSEKMRAQPVMTAKSFKPTVPLKEMRRVFPKVEAALEECLKWMEDIRASTDAGFWEWSDDEYTRAQEVLRELNEIRENPKPRILSH